METLEKNSYKAHQEHYQNVYADPDPVVARIHNWKSDDPLSYYLHESSWKLTNELAIPFTTWLTVGDGYGADAGYLLNRGCTVTASDISATMLEAACRNGFIKDYAVENVEKISFADSSYNYVYCKESYHHFPRPFAAFYEMIRVCNKAVVIQEPIDILQTMPILLFIKNMLDRFNPNLISKLWKNRYSFETVGNFVYKVSEREFEKAAIAIGLPAIAFKGYNHAKTKKGMTDISSAKNTVAWRNILSRLGIIPYEQLSAIIFKSMPDNGLIQRLQAEGYKFIKFPVNPYLSK